MHTAIAILGLAFPAAAADNELSVELGNLRNADPAYDLFSPEDQMPSMGGRAGLALTDRFAARLGYQRTRQGADVYTGDTHFSSAFYADQLTLGVRADIPVADFFLPYASVEALGFRGKIRFDDDSTDKNSPGQVEGTALAFGGLAMGGVELRVPKGSAPFTVAFDVEVGYALIGNLDFGDLGTMKPGGLAVRSGLGVRF